MKTLRLTKLILVLFLLSLLCDIGCGANTMVVAKRARREFNQFLNIMNIFTQKVKKVSEEYCRKRGQEITLISNVPQAKLSIYPTEVEKEYDEYFEAIGRLKDAMGEGKVKNSKLMEHVSEIMEKTTALTKKYKEGKIADLTTDERKIAVIYKELITDLNLLEKM